MARMDTGGGVPTPPSESQSTIMMKATNSNTVAVWHVGHAFVGSIININTL